MRQIRSEPNGYLNHSEKRRQKGKSCEGTGQTNPVSWVGLKMGWREIERSLEQWQMGVKDVQRRMILAPTTRERERWNANLLLAQGWTASATAEALERDLHTIGRWVAAFGEGGPRALIFE